MQLDGATHEQRERLMNVYADIHADRDRKAMDGFLRRMYSDLDPSEYPFTKMAAITLPSPETERMVREMLASRDGRGEQ